MPVKFWAGRYAAIALQVWSQNLCIRRRAIYDSKVCSSWQQLAVAEHMVRCWIQHHTMLVYPRKWRTGASGSPCLQLDPGAAAAALHGDPRAS